MNPDKIADFFQNSKQREDAYKRLQIYGGGGTFDGMEARVAKLEASVKHIEKDVAEIKTDIRDMCRQIDGNFKWLLSVMGGFALLLLGTMAKGFGWI